MRIKVEIPVEIDGPLTANERRQFKAWLQTVVKGEMEKLCGPGARMFTTVCRFAFSEPTVTVGDEGNGVTPRSLVLLKMLVGHKPCCLDPRGYCLAHNWRDDSRCPHALARDFLRDETQRA